MAGVLVDVLIERLATLALDKIERELKLVAGVKEEIKHLTKKLEAIRAVMEAAEQRQAMEADVKHWLDELNDVSFDMDDVLDEWITRVLKYQLEKQERHGTNAVVSAKKKVCFPFPSSCFRFGQVNQLYFRHEIAKKIQELNERLALIDQNKQSFNFQTTTRAVSELARGKTTGLPNDKTFGRDEERNFIVNKLMSERSEGNQIPLIIPIVGMGGMGKTSLANLVYNDDRIKSHFGDMRMWVCVSNPFEEIKIAQAIIETLDKEHPSKKSNDLQILLKCIFDLIKGKRFLLVLDDVWYPNSDQWDEFIKPLRSGAMGSRVLVTTRIKDNATLMKATNELVLLKELGETFCLSLFYYSANKDEKTVSKEFHEIGLELVKRCNGLPLAAKALGRLMRSKETIKEWGNVLDSKIWTLEKIKEDVFRPLLLSYHDMGLAIKRCLLYCVLFLKDYVYNKNTLIELWMSQDYLSGKETNEQRITGQNYFDELVNRSFFQEVEVDEKNGNKTCKIHDTVHDFLQYCTEDQHGNKRKHVVHHLNIDNEPEGGSLRGHPIKLEPEGGPQVFVASHKKLRTWVAITVDLYQYDMELVFEMLVQLKCLRTIILSQTGQHPYRRVEYICIPKMIGKLIHLRYLDLSGNKDLRELTDTIGSLYNLQTLRLVDCYWLKKVDVRRLIKLRHLYVEGCDCLELIQGIEKLTGLQRLDWFTLRDAGDKGNNEGKAEGNKLQDLKDLNQLGGSLAISVRGDPNMAETAGIMLNKTQLLELQLHFYGGASSREIMNELEPHPGLDSLLITCYRGGAFSRWLSSLRCLRVLSIDRCFECKKLPLLGKLTSLESLRIEGLEGVSEVGAEFLGIEQGQTSSSSSSFVSFPSLKQLHFIKMPSWKEWEGVEEEISENITIMPCLSHLTIRYCQNLKGLPGFLWKTPLQKLEVCESYILEELYTPKQVRSPPRHLKDILPLVEDTATETGGLRILYYPSTHLDWWGAHQDISKILLDG